MATLFAIFGMVASFGTGNITQANAITANIIQQSSDIASPLAIAIVLLILSGVILIGGVKNIGMVAGVLVPGMAIIYILGGLAILIINYGKVLGAFPQIFSSAFSDHAAIGGFAGSTLAITIRMGMARGLFSNEAGLGSASITHATAIVKNPIKQDLLGMLDPFLDTIIVCSISALVNLVSGQWTATGVNNAATLTSISFNHALPGGLSSWLVTITLILFAFSTILGLCVYGERCTIYLFGHKAALPFRIIFTLAVPISALSKLTLVWNLADLFNGLMAILNLIALLLLSPVTFKLAKEFFNNPKNLED